MAILEVENLTFSYEGETLIKDVNMRLFAKDHAVLVGPNGSGKSTIMKLLAKKLAPDNGTLKWIGIDSVGYLDQYMTLDKNLVVKQYLYGVFKPLFDKEKAMEELYESVVTADESDYEKILNRASRLGEELEEAGFYGLDSKLNAVIFGLGLDETVLTLPIDHLSGGMRAKIILAKLLLEEADVLLLDEPTNFLDVAHIEWLATFLKNYPKSFIVISHHEGFNKQIATCVLALEGTRINRYKGNFDYYLKERVFRYEHQAKEFANQQKFIEKTEDFIKRNIVRATTTKRAQSRRKMLAKIERIEEPLTETTYKFVFPLAGGTGKEVLNVEDLVIGYDTPLLDPINLQVMRGDKVVITGKNGIGKSTFIKTILKKTEALGGRFSWIETAKIAYLSQEGDFNSEDTPFSVVAATFPSFSRQQVMTILGEYGISYEMANRPLRSLSGGEKTKVRLSLLKNQKGNVLILDEPTNHLDHAAKLALRQALINYAGTLILVSHETSFYQDICDYELALYAEDSE